MKNSTFWNVQSVDRYFSNMIVRNHLSKIQNTYKIDDMTYCRAIHLDSHAQYVCLLECLVYYFILYASCLSWCKMLNHSIVTKSFFQAYSWHRNHSFGLKNRLIAANDFYYQAWFPSLFASLCINNGHYIPLYFSILYFLAHLDVEQEFAF